MATHSGGSAVDWAAVIKPLTVANYTPLSQTEVLAVVKAIVRSETDYLVHDESQEVFYGYFTAVAAYSISGHFSSIGKNHMNHVIEASGVLLRYILDRLDRATISETKMLLPALKCLIVGQCTDQEMEVAGFMAILKNATLPEHQKAAATGTDKEGSKSESKRSRSDLSTVILQQLTAPLGVTSLQNWNLTSEDPVDFTQIIIKANIELMEALHAGSVILRVCTNLTPSLKNFVRYEESIKSGKPLFLPVLQADAASIKSSLSHINTYTSILSIVIQLPILEPLDPEKIEMLSCCAMNALNCAIVISVAISVLHTVSSGQTGQSKSNTQSSQGATGGASSTTAGAAANSGESEDSLEDDVARLIVDKSLEIFTSIGSMFNSTRAHIYQNHLCAGAWLLVSGIQGAMNASGNATSRSTVDETTPIPSGSKGKSPSRSSDGSGRVNFAKVQQGFGVMNAAIANHCLLLLTELVQNLEIESRSDIFKDTDTAPEPAGFDILGQYTALQRIVRVLNVGTVGNVPTIQQMLTFLATVSYRKACAMKRVNVKNDGEPVSFSDSTTYFNDTISCSEGSESDEEDDSYLGIWFKETFSPELKEPTAEETQEKCNENQRSITAAAVKNEPHEYLELSAKVFAFLDTVLNSNHKYLHKHVKLGLSEQQMVLLANILKDLDRDTLRGEPENISNTQLQTATITFSSAIGRYLHNLISMGLISESLQSTLLLHLGVSPWAQETTMWPLQVYSRTLSVLVQILLLKPPQEKEAACLSVWHRLVNTLVDGVCAPQTETEYEDLNVEHGQLLLFLFHSLNLMQKKSVLLLTAGGVIRCAEVCRGITPEKEKTLRDHQTILLSRLLLFLEYLMKHLYNAPTVLLEQVRWNLFGTVAVDPKQKPSDIQNNRIKNQFCRKDIEEKYRKHSIEHANTIRPKFYSFTALDTKVQQEFKLDGLAWNFILCTPDKLKYPLLIDALIDILTVTDQCMAPKMPFQTMCAVNYVFSLCWKLLLGLSPSTPHVEALMQDRVPNLHMLVWSIRCMQPGASSNYLIVNGLVKQGMYTQFAESLWSKITEFVSGIQNRIRNTVVGLDSFYKSFNLHNPRLSKIILLDALISHLYVIFWSDSFARDKASGGVQASSSTSSELSTTGSVSENTHASSYKAFVGSPSDPEMESTSKIDLNTDIAGELLSKLLDALETVVECTMHTMSLKLKGLVPEILMDSLLAISSSKNTHCPEIVQQFTSLISCHKNTALFEWMETLNVATENDLESLSTPIELHTLTVIEAHLNEVIRNPHYSVLPSLKHTILSMVNLIYYLIPCKKDKALMDRLKTQLTSMLYDVRTEYLSEVAHKCLTFIHNGDPTSEQYEFLMFTNILRHSYKLIIDYSTISAQGRNTNFPETILHNVLKSWEAMLDKPMGLKAMNDFFAVKKSGSLVMILLSFTNTSMTQLYSTKILQFFVKLFQSCEKSNSAFQRETLCNCVAEMESTDIGRIKMWLSHILLGPGSVNNAVSVTSAASSNVQTPTNMATVSAIPSISDQQPSDMVIDLNAMDIDFECSNQSRLIEDNYCVWHAGCTTTITTTNQSGTNTPNEDRIEKNGQLLHQLIKYTIVDSPMSSSLANSLFQALIQLGPNLLCSTQESIEFTDVLQVMITLANAGQGKGHTTLFAATIEWLEMSRSNVLEQAQNDKSTTAYENVSALLRYLCDLLQGLGYSGSRLHLPPWDEDTLPEFDDYTDEHGTGNPADEEDDSAIDDSDEDSLGSQLCTYSFTQKEFMNQHWYHCYTCKMVDGVGVCSVCARVCHKNHDISYAKFGNFFCDCGAKDDGSCLALVKRVTPADSTAMSTHKSGGSSDKAGSSRHSENVPKQQQRSADSVKACMQEHAQRVAKRIELSKDNLKNTEQWKSVIRSTIEFFNNMLQTVEENCAKYSTVGCHSRAKNALNMLHQPGKRYQLSNKIMVATLGSQEGAFENVRSNYVGEQSQTIRQLIATNMVRRVGLCCLSSPNGKRQHLAVSHEKGKVTILQLSALLKQADAPKKKLTLSRLSSAPIPCTIMSLEANPANEDLLAVCGLKECHILTFSTNGIASDHIVITPQLETGNFIKRALWLPGSQTMLALITCDYVKIYELAKDTFSPQYNFVVPSGKIRDCTFVYQSGVYYLLLFASSGYIYTQPLVDESLAKHGAFYVTNTLDIEHSLVVDIKGSLGEGGASIYYSHVLQMLFFSYCSGWSFMAPLTDVNEGVKYVKLLLTEEFGFASLTKSPSKSLMQWTEVAGHPGLVFAMVNQSNNPVVFMIKPDTYLMQEIKYTNIKSKIMDMVAIRHTTGGQERTTLLLLCEDGSLRIYAANAELTGYWLSPEVQPIANHMYQSFNPKSMKRLKKKSPSASNSGSGSSKTSSNTAGVASNGAAAVTFPVDFFEDCVHLPEIEFGGNDLLQVYNTQQLKHRLNSTGLYVVSTKPAGFNLEITTSDQNMVITGVRILIGTQDPLRAPQSVTVLGRTVNTLATRPRWFDIPLTRDESIYCDRKLTLTFGPSQDYEHICMLDSIKVYGKNKEGFGWPEETDEANTTTTPSAAAGQIPNSSNISTSLTVADQAVTSLIPLDNMLISMMEVLDCGLSLLGGSSVEETLKKSSMDIATTLVLRPLPTVVQTHSKSVLATLLGNRTAYNAYKDQEILKEVVSELNTLKATEDIHNIDPKSFFRLVVLTRGIAISRPQSLAKYANEKQHSIVASMMLLMQKLFEITPSCELQSSIVKIGLAHTEATIHYLVEIIYAFALSDPTCTESMTAFFVELLLNESATISHSAKHALIRLLRPRTKNRHGGSPPTCQTPTPSTSGTQKNTVAKTQTDATPASSSQPATAAAPSADHFARVIQDAIIQQFDGAVGDAEPEVDDDAIMEIAIALSLQEHEGDMQAMQDGLDNLPPLVSGDGYSIQESDDEGSNAATDGSNLRSSPAEPAGSGGSESGGSGVESIACTSGRSSTYGGDQNNASPPRQESQPPTVPAVQEDTISEKSDKETTKQLHVLRTTILLKMVESIATIDTKNGHQAIPFMQVLLMLTADLDVSLELDQRAMGILLNALIERLDMQNTANSSQMLTRSPKTEVQFVILRLLSVLMAKVKSSSSSKSSSSASSSSCNVSNMRYNRSNSQFVAYGTANALVDTACIPYCLAILKSFLPYWVNVAANNDEPSSSVSLMVTGGAAAVPTAGLATQNVLKHQCSGPELDLQPFFGPSFNGKHSVEAFEQYHMNITEIAVRLPYQILKLSVENPKSSEYLYEQMSATLCEYMMAVQSPLLRRIIRKLLLFICGNKEQFRQTRDIHWLNTHVNIIRKHSETAKHAYRVSGGTVPNTLSYDALVELTEHLRACLEVASVRRGNWQRFCLQQSDVLPVIMSLSTSQLAEGVSPVILQLLQGAICIMPVEKNETKPIKARQDRDKSEETENFPDSKFDPNQCTLLVTQIFTQVSHSQLTKFIKTFLLETNITSIRWQAHALIYAFYEYSAAPQKERLLNCMWDLWPQLPAYGRRTAQFVDLLGYLTLNTKQITNKLPDYMELAVSVLRLQNERLARHPNAPIYTQLSQVLELEGFYLESEPCLVCNNPEVPMSNIKLSSIKIDSKFTTTTTIVKLSQSHTISKIVLRIAELKRAKMVRAINIYYNNRTVQAVVELKNRPAMWHKARKVTLQSGQTDVKIEFPLPITACNLMIEYADFYETATGSSENLQCPRCSAAVPANPGVCANCGENVFQCHKCRAINYDEKDPFLCHSCGFCKYAKFDYNIFGRACCAVDPIESADDRAKSVQTIHHSLEKADRVYRSLQANKQILELLVQKMADQKLDRTGADDQMVGNNVTSQVNKVIQLLAQKYCVESKNSFEELSKIIQKVQACRRELVAYDRSQMDGTLSPLESCSSSDSAVSQNRCYGCALASTEQCLTLLRAMASNVDCRIGLCNQGLVEELAQNNLRRGTFQIQDEVRQLLCLLTRDLPDATASVCNLILTRVKLALSGIVPLANVDSTVRHEMALLESLVGVYDSCWEQKTRVVLEIFLLACRDTRGLPVAVLQPTLKIIDSLICPPPPKSKANKDQTTAALYTIQPVGNLTVNYQEWLKGDASHTFEAWRSRMPAAVPTATTTTTTSKPAEGPSSSTSAPKIEPNATTPQPSRKFRHDFLAEKYATRWRRHCLTKGIQNQELKLTASWLQPILFNTNSRIGRQLATSLIPTLINKNNERKREILDLLTGFLKFIGDAGEASEEFLILYRCLAEDTPWRQYLVLKQNVLLLITDLLAIETEKIHRLEDTTLSSDLAQGYALRQLVELLSMFLDNAKIRQVYKGKLLGPVLQGYLQLRKLVVQRTRLIDDAQEKLLEMLEEMTTGTEQETRAFMTVLIDTVHKTSMNDIKTPVFIFERLCSIIHPEENDVGEFFLTLEKDAQQEDFLQGRMLGNPYPSTEAGLGPLMRDVKNKICMDCELVALLEDDNGMELLVYNKIISLDLPVKEVYKKVWLAEGGERDTMRIVYRMRGLLGDATEEFVETLNKKATEEVDNEQLYRMANVLADDCGGLQVMLDRISSLQNVFRSRSLLQVLLKLFLLAVKVRRCQEVLCQPELGAINTLLRVLQLCLQTENDSQQSAVTEQLLEIMETILSKAASDTLDSFLQFSLTFGGPEYVTALITCTNCSNVQNNPSVLRHLIRVLAALVYGNDLKMALLCDHFHLNFDAFDADHTSEDEFRMELFCVLTNQIEHNSIGGTLKDYIMGLGIVDKSLAYITTHAPCVKPTLLRTDSDELKEFISRPSLKYILRFLTGLATQHEATQLAIAKDIIPIIHRLEQVSSDEHVGSLAENLLEALCTDPTTAKRVQEVRDFTRAEKKRLAMATREKQLDALGMRTNEKGQVTAKGSLLQTIEKLREETGLTCFICREGYACQPTKVLGIYTFTKRTIIEEFEQKPRKTLGYTTVTYFNVVHIDCHLAAIRLARGRDEWESASLQNANTRCNGLLPLFGPEVEETAFASAMSRHNANMQESSQRCDVTFVNSIHDLKLLLLRFAQEKSFHDDAGGGGPQSNMYLVPYLLFYSLYIVLHFSFSREDKSLQTYLGQQTPTERWLECAYDADGPYYQATLSLVLHSPTQWKANRIQHLKRMLVLAHARHVSPLAVIKGLSDKSVLDYSVYKSSVMLWTLIDKLYSNMMGPMPPGRDEDHTMTLFDFIRRNDEVLLKRADSIRSEFTMELLPCTSFAEFCDMADLLNDIPEPDGFLADLIGSLPSISPPSTTA